MRAFAASLLLVVLRLASAAPTPAPLFGINLAVGKTAESKPVSVPQKDITTALVRPVLFARAVYCSSPAIKNGLNVKILVAGGDDKGVPNFFVAHDKDKNTIVVAHQGTEPKNFLSDLNDLNFIQAGKAVKMHDGFMDTQERTSKLILSSSKKMLVVGHSLGAADASIDGMMLKMKLDRRIAVITTVFGLQGIGRPRQQDSSVLGDSFTFVANQDDPVPRVPPHNEIHITAVDKSGKTATSQLCPGQENENCAGGNSILDASVTNHRGPYFANISMGNKFCPL
ncbi:alpha/beta-hydrolase [Ganoderma leucocontextum]|nr:alpha/beta-hydrolase [Ganoderma leucocontextum]